MFFIMEITAAVNHTAKAAIMRIEIISIILCFFLSEPKKSFRGYKNYKRRSMTEAIKLIIHAITHWDTTIIHAHFPFNSRFTAATAATQGV